MASLKRVGLADKYTTMQDHMSGGQQTTVSLTRTMARSN